MLPQTIVDQYNLTPLIHNTCVYMELRKAMYGLPVGKNTNVTSTNVIAGTNIKFSNPLTIGNGTDMTRNNVSDLVAI
jgi:hypothetical protein